MSFILANPNPKNNLVGDCVIRAISLVDEQTWDDTMSEHERQAIMDCINKIK